VNETLLFDYFLINDAIIDQNVVSLYILSLKLVDIMLHLMGYCLKVRNIKRINVFNGRFGNSLHLLQSIVNLCLSSSFFAVSESTHNKQYKYHSKAILLIFLNY